MDRISKLERAKKRLSPAEIRTLFADLAEPFVPGLGAVREGMAGNYGTAAVSGLLDVGGPIGKGVGLAAAPLMGAIKVFHGSPHKFDKFDMSKIGTGEGAQAYGHGLYFAENPKVAGGYARGLGNYEVDGGPMDWNNPSHVAAMQVYLMGGDFPKAADDLYRKAKNRVSAADPDVAMQAVKILDGILDDKSISKATRQKLIPKVNVGNLYEVNLRWPGAREATDPLGPQHFLDFDKPIGQQSKTIQQAINKTKSMLPASAMDDLGGDLSLLYGKDVTPNQFINTWEALAGQNAGERVLNSVGVPGVRYLDAVSRGKGGTSNYVIFDDQLAEILRRNPGLLE